MSTSQNSPQAPNSLALQQYIEKADAALRVGDNERALRIADEAVGKGLEHPNLLTFAAYHRMQMGDNKRAHEMLLRARELAPKSMDVLNALGNCLARLGRHRDALAQYDAALRIAPGTAMLRFNKALAYEGLGELERAKRELELVIDLMPNHFEALAWLATLAAQRNDRVVARRFATRALTLNPRTHLATLALATVDVAEGNFAAAQAALRMLLDDRDLSAMNRATALGLLGDALDGSGHTEEAFRTYTAAKKVLRESYAAEFASESSETAAQRVTRLSDYFRNADADLWRARKHGSAPRAHAFLIGFPRSGTTLLETVLASHPDIETMEERDALQDAVTDFFLPAGGLDKLSRLSSQDLETYRKAYWKVAAEYGHGDDSRVFVDKMPLNTVLLPLIAKLFPNAKIIFAVRDPRDVVLSCFRRRFGMTAQMYELTSLESAAAYYDGVMNLGAVFAEKLDLETRQTKHEDLLADFDSETKAICEFLGVPWHSDMANFADRARETTLTTPSGAQVARGLSSEGAGQWRRYGKELSPVLPLLDLWVARFGYPEA